jgi:hypothetical protein
VISLFERRTRLLDIVRRTIGTKERIDRLLDVDLRQLVGALHCKVIDIETLQRRGGRSRSSLGRGLVTSRLRIRRFRLSLLAWRRLDRLRSTNESADACEHQDCRSRGLQKPPLRQFRADIVSKKKKHAPSP